MPIPSSPISLYDIQVEFGGSNPIGLNEYYRNGSYIPAGTGPTEKPTSGQISLSAFASSSARKLATLPSSGTFYVPSGHYLIDVLIVAGGGSGGAEGSQWNGGGGGGAGGVVYVANLAVSPGQAFSYGVGGGGAAVYNTQGTTGASSYFGGYTAYGGGGGGGWNFSTASNPTYATTDKNGNPSSEYTYRQFDGLPGGSGGGGSSYYGQGRAGAGTAGQGNSGGTGAYDNGYNGGGGGYGGPGYSTAQQTTYSGGIGGAFTFNITPVYAPTVYCAGGGGAGGGFEHPSYGGNQVGNRFARPGYGGGNGGYGGQSGYATSGISATANTGGGGGGAGGAYPNNSGSFYAGNGGSGIIYVFSRYS